MIHGTNEIPPVATPRPTGAEGGDIGTVTQVDLTPSADAPFRNHTPSTSPKPAPDAYSL